MRIENAPCFVVLIVIGLLILIAQFYSIIKDRRSKIMAIFD